MTASHYRRLLNDGQQYRLCHSAYAGLHDPSFCVFMQVLMHLFVQSYPLYLHVAHRQTRCSVPVCDTTPE